MPLKLVFMPPFPNGIPPAWSGGFLGLRGHIPQGPFREITGKAEEAQNPRMLNSRGPYPVVSLPWWGRAKETRTQEKHHFPRLWHLPACGFEKMVSFQGPQSKKGHNSTQFFKLLWGINNHICLVPSLVDIKCKQLNTQVLKWKEWTSGLLWESRSAASWLMIFYNTRLLWKRKGFP